MWAVGACRGQGAAKHTGDLGERARSQPPGRCRAAASRGRRRTDRVRGRAEWPSRVRRGPTAPKERSRSPIP
jgi:hypothetical protein